MRTDTDSGFRFTTKSKVMLLLLAHLALHGSRDKPISLAALCKRIGYSTTYVGRLLTPLRDAGYIAPVNGVKGGYILLINPRDVTVLDVVDTVEGSGNIFACLSGESQCERIGTCHRREVWSGLNDKIRSAFQSVTLADITRAIQADEAHAARGGAEPDTL